MILNSKTRFQALNYLNLTVIYGIYIPETVFHVIVTLHVRLTVSPPHVNQTSSQKTNSVPIHSFLCFRLRLGFRKREKHISQNGAMTFVSFRRRRFQSPLKGTKPSAREIFVRMYVWKILPLGLEVRSEWLTLQHLFPELS